LKKEELHNLFQLNVKNSAPAIIIYSGQVNERLKYTCEFIFKNILNCNYSVTDNAQTFQNSKEFKLNYSNETISGAFHIIPHSLIFEKGINKIYAPETKLKNDLIYFHPNTNGCQLGYDIFASVFYFISRYQEWQPFEGDIHGRFEAKASIQFKHKQHLKPIVNSWIEELKTELSNFYPLLKFPEKKFQYISSIDVDNLFAYKSKGAMRTGAAIAKDICTFQFKNLSRRIKVLRNELPDPFDVYDRLNTLSKKTGTPLIYFFLQRGNTKFDRTIDPGRDAFKQVFEKLRTEKIAFGLHPSYHSCDDADLMKHEFSVIQKNAEQEINVSRQHYLRFDIRTTPFQLIENKVVADFSMGFASSAGYRAGTFTPFYFYDLQNEKQTHLVMVPFAVMDGVYFVYSNSNPAQAQVKIMEMAREVKRLNGTFVTVFHERTFDEVLYPGFGDLYKKLQGEL